MDLLVAESQMIPIYCKYWYKKFDESRSDLSNILNNPKPANNTFLDSIIELLEEELFMSAKKMRDVLDIPKSMLLLKLYNELELVKVDFRWILH